MYLELNVDLYLAVAAIAGAVACYGFGLVFYFSRKG